MICVAVICYTVQPKVTSIFFNIKAYVKFINIFWTALGNLVLVSFGIGISVQQTTAIPSVVSLVPLALN